MRESEKWKWSRPVLSDSSQPHGLQPTRFLRPWDFPGKSTGVGCHCLLPVSKQVTLKMLVSENHSGIIFPEVLIEFANEKKKTHHFSKWYKASQKWQEIISPTFWLAQACLTLGKLVMWQGLIGHSEDHYGFSFSSAANKAKGTSGSNLFSVPPLMRIKIIFKISKATILLFGNRFLDWWNPVAQLHDSRIISMN